jgi:hypothetical protein
MKTLTALAASLVLAASLAHAAPTPPASGLSGEVLEVQDVEMYTYLRLKTATGETWAAVTKANVKKGSRVTIANPMTMENFESKALKRKFDTIVFGQIADASGAAAAPGPAMAMPMPGQAPAAAAAAPVEKIAKATGPDARTIAEVVAGRAKLKDKTVLVRGKVVKVNTGIMGKNWIHLQDGSGAAADGSNDILVTTKDVPALGDIVNARGTVRTDVKLGAGYDYAVLVEDAAVRK